MQKQRFLRDLKNIFIFRWSIKCHVLIVLVAQSTPADPRKHPRSLERSRSLSPDAPVEEDALALVSTSWTKKVGLYPVFLFKNQIIFRWSIKCHVLVAQSTPADPRKPPRSPERSRSPSPDAPVEEGLWRLDKISRIKSLYSFKVQRLYQRVVFLYIDSLLWFFTSIRYKVTNMLRSQAKPEAER
jgi:hypothetical protein